MQPPFPTKKFFLVLLFLIVAAGGAYKLFEVLNSRSAQKASTEKTAVILQNEIARNTKRIITDPINEQPVATSTLNAVAAVVYLNQQTKENGATMEEISAKVGKQIQEVKNKLDGSTYTKNDIILINDNGADALRKYGNDMAGIFVTRGNGKSGESYLVTLKRALEKNDPTELKKLDTDISFYKNIIKDSLALAVPSSAASVHLNIINSYAEMLVLIQGFQASFNDLPSAVAAYSRLEKSAIRFMNSYRDAMDFFMEKEVTFALGEKGSLFMGITQNYIKK
jgi:hypothetical protein